MLHDLDRGYAGASTNNLIKATERFIQGKAERGHGDLLTPQSRPERPGLLPEKGVRDQARAISSENFDMALAVQISEDSFRRLSPGSTTSSTSSTRVVNVAIHRRPWSDFSPPLHRREDELDRAEDSITSITPADALWRGCCPCTVHRPDLQALVETSAGENGARMARWTTPPGTGGHGPESDAQIQQGETIGDHCRLMGHRGRDRGPRERLKGKR